MKSKKTSPVPLTLWSLKLGTHGSEGLAKLDRVPKQGDRVFLYSDAGMPRCLAHRRPLPKLGRQVDEVTVDRVSLEHQRIHASFV